MFDNTLVLPHSGGDITVTKFNQDKYCGEYRLRTSTSEVLLTIRHTTTKATATKPMADRHNVEVREWVYATESVPAKYRKDYIVIERQPDDLDTAMTSALLAMLGASSGAMLVRLLSWES